MGPAILLACEDLVEAGALELALEQRFAADVEVWPIERALHHRGALRPEVLIVSSTPARVTALRRALPPECTVIVLQDESAETETVPGKEAILIGRPIEIDRLVASVKRRIPARAGQRNREVHS